MNFPDREFRIVYTQVAEYFNVNLDAGLSDTDVFKSRSRYGRNELAPEEGEIPWELIGC